MRILALNEPGQEVSAPTWAMHVGSHPMPWLQDTSAQNAWARWAPTYRDVVIVDAQNQKVDVFNVTEHDLADASNFATLKQKLLDAANAQ